MKRIFILTLLTVCFQWAFATVYYVSPSGNDATGNGTSTSPWRTLKFAVTKVPASQGHTIKLSAGTFIENGQFNVPLGVSIEGSGVDQTIIKPASSFYFNPADPGFALDKFLITLSSSGESNGNQSLKSFTLDGDGKRLHGGIYVRFRNNVLIENIKVQNTNFCGLWVWDVKYSAVKQVKLLNCSWASTGWAAGALMLSNLQNVEFARMDIDESMGYGVKALGTSGHKLVNMKFHDSRVSVVPTGKWNNGSAPNISIELWSVDLIGCELYNTYMDNHLSLVAGAGQSTSQSIRVYNNIIDLLSRANGNGYGIELSVSNAEVDHNWIRGGTYGIAHWSPAYMSNWKIHHNTFYGLNNGYPGDIVRSQKSGIHNVKVYNNTVEFTGTTTINFIGLHGGPSDNVEIKNNLIINSNTSYSWFPNQLVFMENGATLSGLTVTNNLLDKLPIGNVAGTYANNKLVSGQISKAGNRPDPYYLPTVGSALIDAGVNVGYAFQGSAPDIGAYEIGGIATVAVTGVSITPGNFQLSANVTSQLTKTISPANATNQNVSWSSSNMGVASVSSTGLVTAGSTSGNATITCTTADGSKTATSIVTVSAPIPVVTVSITNPNPTLSVGATTQLTKVIGPVNATNQNVTWSSSNTAVASISPSGLVTALAAGNTTLTVKTADGSKTATSLVNVTAASSGGVTTVDIDDGKLGTSTNQFNYNGAWTHGTNSSSAYLNETCSYSNIASNYVTLNFTGNKAELFTSLAPGHGIAAVSVDNGPEKNVDLYAATRQNFTMVFSSGSLSQGNHSIKIRVTGSKNAASTGTYVVLDYLKVYSGTVASNPVTSISVSPANLILTQSGATSQLTKVISPANATNQNVIWSSSNTSVATVNASGLVTAKANGNAAITVTTADGNKIAVSAVAVNISIAAATTADIDDSILGAGTNQFNYSGAWTHGTNASDAYLKATCSYSNVSSNYVTLSFTGNKVELFTSLASGHGIAAVSIDNGPEKNVDLYAATRQNYSMVFSSGTLAQGNHSIKIRVTGTKNAASTGTYIVLDYLKVYTISGGGGGGSQSLASTMEEEVNPPVQYFPNPVKAGDILNVKLPMASGEVTVISMTGVPLLTLPVTNSELQIPTSGLLRGMYLLQYRTRNNNEVVKIMVQ